MGLYQQQLEQAFPRESDAVLARTVAQGILLAADVMENEPFLASLIGDDIRGHVRRAAVLFNLHAVCQAGGLPYATEMTKMPLGGAHHVEITSGAFRAHVCRTEGPMSFPVDTPTRQDQRLSNQFEMAFDPVVVPIRPTSIEQLYAWLMFGAAGRNLTHLCWGMPMAGQNTWLARVNVLARGGAEVSAAPEAPSQVVKLRFRDHVEEALRRDDEKSDGPA